MSACATMRATRNGAFALSVMLLSIVVGIRLTRMTPDRRGAYISRPGWTPCSLESLKHERILVGRDDFGILLTGRIEVGGESA